MKSVIMIDDHPLFREGLKSIMAGNKSYKIVGEAGTIKEGMDLISKLKPDIVLLDLSLPDGNGIQVIAKILEISPLSRILVVSVYSKINFIREAFNEGAFGYIIKESAPEGLIRGLDTVAKGEKFLDGRLAIEFIVYPREKKPPPTDSGYEGLTNRQREVFDLLAYGHDPKDIALKFGIAKKTVLNHRSAIMKKLELENMVQFLHYAKEIGVLDD